MKMRGIFLISFFVVVLRAEQLLFEDTFDGNGIDDSKWKHEQTLTGGGDWQFQWYVKDPRNAFTRDGILHIKPTMTESEIGVNKLHEKKVVIDDAVCTSSINYGCSRQGTREHIINPIRSASIQTIKAFKYGVVEIKAKLPAGDWLRPTIKLLPKTNFYGEWPTSGEIDLVEARGNRKYQDDFGSIGIDQMTSTLHFGPNSKANGWENAHYIKNSDKGFNEDFHIYKLDWSENGITIFVDNDEIGKFSVSTDKSFWELGQYGINPMIRDKTNPWARGTAMAPFDQEFFISIGLAVGGVSNYFSDDFENQPYAKPWSNDSPKAPLKFWNAKSKWLKTWTLSEDSADFQIDYVKVFSK